MVLANGDVTKCLGIHKNAFVTPTILSGHKVLK